MRSGISRSCSPRGQQRAADDDPRGGADFFGVDLVAVFVDLGNLAFELHDQAATRVAPQP